MNYDTLELELRRIRDEAERMPGEFAAHAVKAIEDGAAAEAAREQTAMSDDDTDLDELDPTSDADIAADLDAIADEPDEPDDLDEDPPPPSHEAVAVERLRRRMSTEADIDADAYAGLPGEAPTGPDADRTARALQTATEWFQRRRAEASDEVLDAADELDDADGVPLHDD